MISPPLTMDSLIAAMPTPANIGRIVVGSVLVIGALKRALPNAAGPSSASSMVFGFPVIVDPTIGFNALEVRDGSDAVVLRIRVS